MRASICPFSSEGGTKKEIEKKNEAGGDKLLQQTALHYASFLDLAFLQLFMNSAEQYLISYPPVAYPTILV